MSAIECAYEELKDNGPFIRKEMTEAFVAEEKYLESAKWLSGYVAKAFKQFVGVNGIGPGSDGLYLSGRLIARYEIVRTGKYSAGVKWEVKSPDGMHLTGTAYGPNEFDMEFGTAMARWLI